MANDQRSIYEPQFVRSLFDDMARTYGIVNLVSSFGFARRWRRQCVRAIHIDAGTEGLDLMTGTGELCREVASVVGTQGRVTALDISPAMCALARRRGAAVAKHCSVEIVEGNALRCPFRDDSIDFVLSSFGLKTFTCQQLAVLAKEIARVLRPGGRFSLLEISVPPSRLLRIPYMAYIRYLIPLIGLAFKGNADNYRLLAVYTQAFGNCEVACDAFAAAGLNVTCQSYFFGCATGLHGFKPEDRAGSQDVESPGSE